MIKAHVEGSVVDVEVSGAGYEVMNDLVKCIAMAIHITSGGNWETGATIVRMVQEKIPEACDKLSEIMENG